MSWIEVRARFSPLPDDLSPFVDLYLDHGIENTLEEGDSLVGCLVDVEGSESVVNDLSVALRKAGASDVATRELPEENWEIAWRQFFKPRRVGKRFVIRPTWEEFDARPEDLVIVLDPGQAFGTGDHPTTRLSLELVESANPVGKTVADVGCGSGILAIGALLLGASLVEAVDIDPIAVEVTKENAERNGVSFKAIAGEGIRSLVDSHGVTADDVDRARDEWEQDEHPLPAGTQIQSTVPTAADGFQYDVVVSNIISAILIRISHEVAAAVRPGGDWIVSGIIVQNWPDVLAAAERAGFSLEERLEEDGWVAARFLRDSG